MANKLADLAGGLSSILGGKNDKDENNGAPDIEGICKKITDAAKTENIPTDIVEKIVESVKKNGIKPTIALVKTMLGSSDSPAVEKILGILK